MDKIRWQKMVDDTKKFFISPKELYQNFEKEGGILEPVIYVVLMSLIGEIILIFLFNLFHPGYIALNLVICLFFVPIIIVSFFASSLILHFIWVLLGSNENFETSLRCNASFSPLFPAGIFLYLIPFFGKWIGFFIYFFVIWYYLVLASVYVHNIDEEKAKKSFLIILSIMAVLRFFMLIRWEIRERNIKKRMEEINRRIEEDRKKWEEYEKKMLEQQQKMLQQSQPNYQ